MTSIFNALVSSPLVKDHNNNNNVVVVDDDQHRHLQHPCSASAVMANRRLRDENVALQKQVAQGRQKIQTLAKQLSAASADVAKSVHSVAQYGVLESRLAKCAAERDAARSALAESQSEAEESRGVIDELQRQVQEIDEASKMQQEAREETIDALKDLLRNVSEQVTDVRASKEAVESELAKSREKVGALQEQAADMTRKHKALQQECQSLVMGKADMAKKIVSLEDVIQTKEQDQKKLETKIAELAYEKQSLQKELVRVHGENKELQLTRNSLVVTVAKRDQTIQTQRSVIQNLETDKAHGNVEIKRVKHELLFESQSHQMALAEIDQLQAELETTKTAATEQATKAQRTQHDLRNQLSVLQSEKDGLENDLDMTLEELDATRSDVSNLKNIILQRDLQIEAEKEKLASLGDSEEVKVLNGGGTIAVSESHF